MWLHLNNQKAELECRHFTHDRRRLSDSWHHKVITLWMSDYVMSTWYKICPQRCQVCFQRSIQVRLGVKDEILNLSVYLQLYLENRKKINKRENGTLKWTSEMEGHSYTPSRHICYQIPHYPLQHCVVTPVTLAWASVSAKSVTACH